MAFLCVLSVPNYSNKGDRADYRDGDTTRPTETLLEEMILASTQEGQRGLD